MNSKQEYCAAISEKITMYNEIIDKIKESDPAARELENMLETVEVSGHEGHSIRKRFSCTTGTCSAHDYFNILLFVRTLDEVTPVLHNMRKLGYTRRSSQEDPRNQTKIWVYQRVRDDDGPPRTAICDIQAVFSEKGDGITCRYVKVGEHLEDTMELRCFDENGNMVPTT